ncbi:MAG: sulfite exporter TauE/SafE family protein [Nitrosopumilus sp.]
MDYSLYWFMLPMSTLVATGAMLGGIGGAAMFLPIFLIIFPLLGPEYLIASPVAAIGVALLTEAFGFTSGLIGYLRRHLIDFKVAKSLIVIAVPSAIVGSFLSHEANPDMLKIMYGILMLILAYIILGRPSKKEKQKITEDTLSGKFKHIGQERVIKDNEGNVYKYHLCHPGKGRIFTMIGGFITGLMAVGIGEIVTPQLVKQCKIPVSVAAATSVFVIIITVAAASGTHVYTLVSEGGTDAIPWHLVMYTAPGVVIGGQIGTRLQGRFSQEKMEKMFGVLFGVIGIAMISEVFIL